MNQPLSGRLAAPGGSLYPINIWCYTSGQRALSGLEKHTVPEGQLATAPLPAPGAVLDLMRSGFLSNLLSLRRRYSAYLATEVEKEVSEHDDMLAGGKLDHYLSVGQSAIDVVARAMVAAQKDS
jgi:hypothetical protein